jgi:hypothetical protein
MKISTLFQGLGQAVASLPPGADTSRAVGGVIRNGDLNFIVVFTDGINPETGTEGLAMTALGIPLVTLDEGVPDHVLRAVDNAAAEYRGKQREGLVP